MHVRGLGPALPDFWSLSWSTIADHAVSELLKPILIGRLVVPGYSGAFFWVHAGGLKVHHDN